MNISVSAVLVTLVRSNIKQMVQMEHIRIHMGLLCKRYTCQMTKAKTMVYL